jgi:hypothetical protein
MKKVYDYTLYVKGIFGRNRKVKFQSFRLSSDNEAQKNAADVLQLAEEMLSKIKLKGNYWFKICEQPCELEKRGEYETKVFQLYSDTVLKEENRG